MVSESKGFPSWGRVRGTPDEAFGSSSVLGIRFNSAVMHHNVRLSIRVRISSLPGGVADPTQFNWRVNFPSRPRDGMMVQYNERFLLSPPRIPGFSSDEPEPRDVPAIELYLVESTS
jgi:hypothetical protein